MSWPSYKGEMERSYIVSLPAQERDRIRAEKKRLKDLNLCSFCKTEPRYSTQTICLKCHNDRRRKTPIEELNKRRRKVALGLCARCGEKPRHKNQSYCLDCKRDMLYESRLRTRKQASLIFVDKVMHFRCLKCKNYLESPVTRKFKVRFVCWPCYRQLWYNRRFMMGPKPFTVIRELIRAAKIKAGIYPTDAWSNTGPRKKDEVIKYEVRRLA